MKIALVNPFSFTYQGGVQEHVKALYKVLKSLGQRVKVIAPRYLKEEDYGEDFILLGSSIVVPGNDSRVSLSYAFPLEVDEVLRRELFDVFHFHSFLPFLPFQVLDGAKKGKAIKVLTSHSNIEGSFFATALGGITEMVIDSFVGEMDGVISVSNAAEKMVKRFKGQKVIIPNGIDLGRFNPEVTKIPAFCDGKINILFVGRLDRRKGMQILLPAFALVKKRFKNTRLIVVGDGFLREELEGEVRGKIEDVVFAGEVKAEKTPDYYASADIFCAPSIRGETFGIILLEAMAAGLPVVASAIEGYREVMPKEASDFLVAPGNPELLSSALVRLIEDQNLRSTLRSVGLAHAKGYDWQVVGRRILDFYQEVGRLRGHSLD